MAKNRIEISLSDLKFEDNLHSDCGGWGFSWTCPNCKEEMRWAPYAWWDLICSCTDWDIEIKAIGTPCKK